MRQHKRQKKSIREIDTPRHYHGGEASPYWDFLSEHGSITSEGQPEENVLANPDILSEDEHLFHRPLTERGEFQFQIIRDVLKDLSPQQQKVLQLHGVDGMSLKDVAKELDLSISTVQTFLLRARRVIKRRYYEVLKEK